jgi:sterol desaturase/sphingolipid hydroxylase (fatty acid hydroxylase superfamily)
MTAVALVEALIPLHPRCRSHRDHLIPNLALTLITFATNIVFNAVLVVTLVRLERSGTGLLHAVPIPALATFFLTVLLLDFSSYVAHVAMHKTPVFWRFHRVHHSDPAVDVTTTVRQHPGEGVIRYAFMGAFALSLGASPAAFAVYRAWSVLNGLLEHANIRVPRRLDTLLSLVVATPNMHKVHHSRLRTETDTNYGNIAAIFDRLFSTFTRSERGLDVTYGLNGYDDPTSQGTIGLLALPFRDVAARPVIAAAAKDSLSDRDLTGACDPHLIIEAPIDEYRG